MQLPQKSRVFTKVSPMSEWDFEDETQSRILLGIETLIAVYVNANKKKGSPKVDPPAQYLPEMIKDKRDELSAKRKGYKPMTGEELDKFLSRDREEIKVAESFNKAKI